MMPAFSPGPCSTSLLRVGRRFRCTRDDLYEQCSLHITLKMPSSVMVGSRPPSNCLTFSYSSGVRPCSRTICAVMARIGAVVMGKYYCRILEGLWIEKAFGQVSTSALRFLGSAQLYCCQ